MSITLRAWDVQHRSLGCRIIQHLVIAESRNQARTLLKHTYGVCVDYRHISARRAPMWDGYTAPGPRLILSDVTLNNAGLPNFYSAREWFHHTGCVWRLQVSKNAEIFVCPAPGSSPPDGQHDLILKVFHQEIFRRTDINLRSTMATAETIKRGLTQ